MQEEEEEALADFLWYPCVRAGVTDADELPDL